MNIKREDHTYKNGDYKRYFEVDENRIFGFFEDYRFLSNFHTCPVFHDGVIWPSSEHAYMISKCVDKSSVDYDNMGIFNIQKMSCSEVKKWGQTVKIRDDWEQIKVGVMLQINLDKYIRNLDLRTKLLLTGYKELIEANSWGDSVWGFDVDKNKGENKLGEILMTVRSLLRKKL